MQQKLCKVYEASLNGKVIARGFADEVAEKIGVSKQSVIWCGANDGTANGKYQVTTVGWATKYYNKKGDCYYSEISPIGETFVERYFCLDNYGNTIMSNKEYKRHKALIEDKGYTVKYTKKKDGRKTYYLLEVI